MQSKPSLETHPSVESNAPDFDIMEELSCLISPNCRASFWASTPSEHGSWSTSTSTFSPSNPKVSPLVTVDCGIAENRSSTQQLEEQQPQPASSVRGYDLNNNPVYSSSQTPYGFQAITKRKPAKKNRPSVFNFEGFDDVIEKENARSIDSCPEDVSTGDSITGGMSSPDEDGISGGNETRRFLRTGRHQQAVNALTEEEDTPVAAHMPARQLNTYESLDDTTFKKAIACTVETSRVIEVSKRWDELSPMVAESNPRKKTSSYTDNSLGVNPENMTYAPFNSPAGYYSNIPPTYPSEAYVYPLQAYGTTQEQVYGTPHEQAYCVDQNMTLPSIHALQSQASMNVFPPQQAALGLHLQQVTPSVPTSGYVVHPVEATLPIVFDNELKDCATETDYGLETSFASMGDDVDQFGTGEGDGEGEGEGNKGKGKEKVGSRAGKSLAEISKRFVSIYGTENAMDYIAGQLPPNDVTDAIATLHRVDSAAETLQVHVRRIYELIKILEILSFVAFAGDKRGKFNWRGTKHFLHTLGAIQEDGMVRYAATATQNGLFTITAEDSSAAMSKSNSPGKAFPPGTVSTANIQAMKDEVNGRTPEEHFMVEIICKNFLQLFLVGMNCMSMSAVIQKLIPMEEKHSLSEYNKINATKIRRVYDVTNVLCSLNLLRKKSIPRKKAQEAEAWNNLGQPVDVVTADGKGKSPTKTSRAGERADAKVLEWISFPPAVIRQYYLASKQPVKPASTLS
eukprot:gene87-94_t